jgi:hypothetical protein
MSVSQNNKNDVIVITAKYYLKANGSAVINIPQNFEIGLENGEELVTKWDGYKLVLMPLKGVKFK